MNVQWKSLKSHRQYLRKWNHKNNVTETIYFSPHNLYNVFVRSTSPYKNCHACNFLAQKKKAKQSQKKSAEVTTLSKRSQYAVNNCEHQSMSDARVVRNCCSFRKTFIQWSFYWLIFRVWFGAEYFLGAYTVNDVRYRIH